MSLVSIFILVSMTNRSRPARAFVVTAHPHQMPASVKAAHATTENLGRKSRLVGKVRVWIVLFRRAAAVGSVAVLVQLLVPAPVGAIVGGIEADGGYGFMGSLQRIDSPRDDLHVCGVSLIAPEWGITAGHCLRNAADVVDVHNSGHPVGWRARFGSVDVRQGGELVDVVQFVKLGGPPAGDDIGLVKFNHAVKQVPVPVGSVRPTAGTAARIMGWGAQNRSCGAYNDDRCYPAVLRQADTAVQPIETCSYRRNPAILCIGARDGTVGPGNMDSGGPALVKNEGQWKLAGITEGTSDTGSEAAPSWYVDVTRHLEKVKNYIAGHIPLPPDSPAPEPSVNGTIEMGNCSGAVIRGARTQPQDHVLVLTNGHCVNARPNAAESIGPIQEMHNVIVLSQDGNAAVRAKSTDLVYATMTGTDLAVYRLDINYADLAGRGIRVFEIADNTPRIGQKFQLLSGIWQKGVSCTIDAIVPVLREGGYVQRRALRYKKNAECDPGAGTSGSPLVGNDGAIFAIHNTSTFDIHDYDRLPPQARSDEPEICAEGNACEVRPSGATETIAGMRYGQQLLGLGECLDSGSQLNFEQPGCLLPKPAGNAPGPSGGPRSSMLIHVTFAVLVVIAAIGLGWSYRVSR